jgi:hypothetical protein
MKKKSQIGQVFIYLVSTLIIILVLYYGYNAIKSIGKKQQELSYVKFQRALTDMVAYTSSDYGTVRVEDFSIPGGFNKVCFVDRDMVKLRNTSAISEDNYPLIYDSVQEGTQANVFVLPGGSPFYIDKMKVAGGFSCSDISQGKIRVRIEGRGDVSQITVQ